MRSAPGLPLILLLHFADVVFLLPASDHQILPVNAHLRNDFQHGVLHHVAVERQRPVAEKFSGFALGRADAGTDQNIDQCAASRFKMRHVPQARQQVVRGDVLDLTCKQVLADPDGFLISARAVQVGQNLLRQRLLRNPLLRLGIVPRLDVLNLLAREEGQPLEIVDNLAVLGVDENWYSS